MAQRRRVSLQVRATNALRPAIERSERDKDFAYVVIEAQNLWANFLRSYLLSCLFSPRRIRGDRVALGNAMIRLPGDLLHAAAKAQKGPTAAAPTARREEPAWHDVNVFLRTCQDIQCSHLIDVQTALSVSTRAFYDIPVFRNFYAHRNEESAQKALALARKQYLITTVRHPTDALATPALKRPQALILDWLDDLDVVMELLCD